MTHPEMIAEPSLEATLQQLAQRLKSEGAPAPVLVFGDLHHGTLRARMLESLQALQGAGVSVMVADLEPATEHKVLARELIEQIKTAPIRKPMPHSALPY